MGKNIGIKLADGSFYPILEEGVPKKKLLELTTVQDNQTTIMVDLYSSETNSMADAQYVDTLQISSLIPHPEGEPNICLSVQIDENNVLSAEVSDAESGTSSNTSVELISRTEAERAETPNPIEDVTLADENAFADDSFPAEFEDTIPESEVLDMPLNSSELDSLPDFDDTPSLSDSILSDYAETINVRESSLPDFSKFELPDFDDQPQEDDYIGNNRLFDESDFDDPAFQVQNQQEQNAGFDFSGLYDDPEENKTEKKKHKNTAAVVICIICALICLATLGIILFFLPSQISIDITKKNPSTEVIEINQTETEIINEQNITELKDIPLPPQPEPKEDVIVISETPAVVPIVPPEPEKEIDVVVYKIKWGDTLWDLAETYYNNPWLYKKIASANNITNPDHIISGTEIIIPAK